jgi:HD-like signal output (HDOD) protein
LTRHLLEGQRQPSPSPTSRVGVGFTAGLLHDFGKIILVYNFPNEAAAFYEEQALDHQVQTADIREMEQLLFGCDHTEAGEYVARKLSFPDALTDVIRFHHTPDSPTSTPETNRVVAAVAAANEAAKAMGYAFTQVITWDEAQQHPAWTLLGDLNPTRYADTEALVADLQAQQEFLDPYVHEMTASTDPDELRARLQLKNGTHNG